MRPIATHVLRSVVHVCVSLCVMGTEANRAKTDEPIEMLFGGRADSMTRRAVPLPQRNLMLYDNASKTQRGLNERKKNWRCSRPLHE